jgi:hypothetical protein
MSSLLPLLPYISIRISRSLSFVYSLQAELKGRIHQVLYTMQTNLRSNGSVATDPDAMLANMGYKSELPRNLSMMSILGL